LIIASSATNMKKENPEESVQNPYSDFACFCFFLFFPISTSLPILSQFSQSKSLEPTIKI
jgi:hypothetical protein